MNISDIAIPDIYRSSADFRFFLKWFELALTKIQQDTENLLDLYDPLRCPKSLLWMLADTMGFKYDDRPMLTPAFNRLILLYFMSMIRLKGSKDGVTLAAEVNLAQFNQLKYGQESPILYDRLEDTSIPVNSAYVMPYTELGYIDVVYFSDRVPVDACIEYVRPLGMYIGQHAGVRVDSRTKISVDSRLVNAATEGSMSIGPTWVGHYSREDYARMERGIKINYDDGSTIAEVDSTPDSESEYARRPVWGRNSDVEDSPELDAGQRALYSLQLSNNDHIVESLLPAIFTLGSALTDTENPEKVIGTDDELSDTGDKLNLIYHVEIDVTDPTTQTKHTVYTSAGEDDQYSAFNDPTSSSEPPLVDPTINPVDEFVDASPDT